MPSFDGLTGFFGAAYKISTSNVERSTQINEFFGLDGIEALDGGFRGRITVATGIAYGDTINDVASVIETIRGYDNGLYYTLIDSAGVTWPLVRLRTFNYQERAYVHSQLGYCRNYAITFHHLA